jgi:hypothetical protein
MADRGTQVTQDRSVRISRRRVIFSGVYGASSLFWGEEALAFGEEGAFHARVLENSTRPQEDEVSAGRRWAHELTRRTSAPGRLSVSIVKAQDQELLSEPFLIWAGRSDPGELSSRAVRALRQYLRLGGVLLVDDSEPQKSGEFGAGARREIARVLPDAGVVRLPSDHVIYKTFYILDQPVGRVLGPEYMEALVRGRNAQVLFLQHDLLGALARQGETWRYPMERGGSDARELAIRFAVNLAMYVLCSDYKDDQVHAPFLMRRRHRRR